MTEWQPIETCPENTWVLVWAPWREEYSGIGIGKFQWLERSEWETVSESSGKSGARRQVRQEHITKEREWDGDSGDYWMPLPAPPSRVQAVGE